MSTVASIVYSDVPGFPPGSAVAAINVVVTPDGGPANPAVQAPPGSTSVDLGVLAVGGYSFSVFATDANSAILGTPVTGTFSVAAPSTISLSLPSSVSMATT